jgi:lipopolysaccharide transport system ATP-binding protein
MSDVVIRAERLGKKYVIGHEAERERYVALRDVLVRGAKNAWRKTADMARGRAIIAGDTTEEFWALKDVSFEMKRGEVLGIIGRNGAGKSTLLKILSRITEPTEGRVTIEGRVASLLEVGTGFHPELTGRENIFLNGAILGMTKKEIKAKFDEIVAFANVESFLDTPVKRYSSGMHVRLAFAVAAHLEPEIMVVDEVLAVGDAEFQKKCLGKMSDVAKDGRTVLLVSHNMGAVQSLCSRAVVLEKGEISYTGSALKAVEAYSRDRVGFASARDITEASRQGTGEARIVGLRIENDQGDVQAVYRMGEPVNFIVDVKFAKEKSNPTFGVTIVTDDGVTVADCRSAHYGVRVGRVSGFVRYRVRIETLALYPRSYSIEAWVTDSACLVNFDWVKDFAELVVTTGPNFLSGANLTRNHGISFIQTTWRVEVENDANTNERNGEACIGANCSNGNARGTKPF